MSLAEIIELDAWAPNPASFDAAIAEVAAVAAEHADAVDRMGRFPTEAMTALRQAGLLGAIIPAYLGGLGLDLSRIGAGCCTLGQACSATAMIFAMHQSQVACLLRHGMESPWHQALLRRIAYDGLLVASVTSEAGVGGQMRISRCAIDRNATQRGAKDQGGGRLRVEKHSTALSYGAEADIFLLTARRHADAHESDQVLIALDRADITFERTGGWDTLGMRGTCTEAFILRAQADPQQVLAEPFASIASETMVPVSHLVWSSTWLGIAVEAVQRTRAALRAAMRGGCLGSEGNALPAGTTRFAAAVERLQMVQTRVADALARFDNANSNTNADGNAARCLQETANISSLKTSVSEDCLWVVQQAMLACGLPGYQNTGPFSLSRHLRDLQSAPLMISNDRIRESSARVLLARRPSLGLV